MRKNMSWLQKKPHDSNYYGFNDAIAAMSLREVTRVGARYTWTNKQLNPVRCVLDRVFVSPAWEASFPLCTLKAITRIGSDHTPLLLCSGDDTVSRPSRFMFQTWWFEVPDFLGTVRGKLEGFLANLGPQRGSVDAWLSVARSLRQFLRGWGANLGKAKREFRGALMAQVVELDRLADSVGLDEDGWALRYHLEDQLILADKIDEEY
jgi:hypothetical protein